jgi:hypothetical protein
MNPRLAVRLGERTLAGVSGEPILRQNSDVFMGFKQAWLKQSLALFLAPTKYRLVTAECGQRGSIVSNRFKGVFSEVS